MNDLKVILIRCIPYAVCAAFSLAVIIRTIISVKRIRTDRKTDYLSSGTKPSIPTWAVLAYRLNLKPFSFSKNETDALNDQHEKLLKSMLEQKQIKIYADRKMRLHKSYTEDGTMYSDEKNQ